MFPKTLPDLIHSYSQLPIFKNTIGGPELALWWSDIEHLLRAHQHLLKRCGCISIYTKHGDRDPFVEGYVLYIYKPLSPELWALAVVIASLKAPGRRYRFLIWRIRGCLTLCEKPDGRLIGPLPR